MTNTEQQPKRTVALIGSYVPRRCGIATFTHDLGTALSETVFGQPLNNAAKVGVVALNDIDGGYAYGPQVIHQIGHHRKEDYRDAADFLNHSKFDVVCVQHEYGIFGGPDGDYLLELTERLSKPIVTTLHTVLADPSEGQRNILQRLCRRSRAVVVMAHRAQRMLGELYEVPESKIHLIHHGVPDVKFSETEPFKGRFEVAGRPLILTFGLLSTNKGIEMMLDALAQVVPENPNVAYIVLGATHPGVKRESGEAYRLSLEKRALALRIQDNVIFHNRYVSLEDLCEYLQAADIYVTPYRNREQIVSGTLAYAVACGAATIATPYWYAEELLADGRGRIVGFDDRDGLARHLKELLADPGERTRLRRAAYDFGRNMIWSRVAGQYAAVFADVCHVRAAELVEPAVRARPALRLSLPEVRLDHLYRLSDETGLLQHAVHAAPDRRHGYCTDDNSRALIVTAMQYTLFRDEEVLPRFWTYLSFVQYAGNEDTGRYRNFMSYDRRWLEENGSDDCQGRVLWALGYVVAHAPDDSSRMLCSRLFEQAALFFKPFTYPRSMALGILGCYYYLRQDPDAEDIRDLMRTLADRLVRQFRKNESDDWPWLEKVVTYENARLTQAVILAGIVFKDQELIRRGTRVLDWLLRIQTGPGGEIAIIGNEGWLSRGGRKADYDQQPLECAALIGACKAAYRATNDLRYLGEMRRCFDWYLGHNSGNCPMIDFKSRGCYDGLTADGVNPNQGAESVLSWLLSLLIMHEMQTGDPTAAG